MKWIEAIAKIDPNAEPGNHYTSPVWEGDISTFAPLFDLAICWNSEFSRRMLKHWVASWICTNTRVASWICTNTRVGGAIYCLDKEPVAVSFQPARKADEIVKFLSAEAAEKVRQAVLQYIEVPEQRLVNLDENVPALYLDKQGFTTDYRFDL